MTEYFAWWMSGGFVGIAAGALVLRHRRMLTARSIAVFLVAAIACLYGAKLQHRLQFHPLTTAAMIAPHELLEPGVNIPLGLVCAVGAALLACRVLRLSRVQMLDALAMATAVMMPIGRIGCLRVGCCLGSTCPWWLRSVCLRPQSEPTTWIAAADGLASLPLHPLPVYFGLLGLGLALLYVHLLRRGARPGTLAAVHFFAYPLGQLAIEPLRAASESRGTPMIVVLLTTMAVDIAAVGMFVVARRRSSRSLLTPTWLQTERSRTHAVPRIMGAVLLAMIGAMAVPARAELDPGIQARWESALRLYAQEPYANLHVMLSLGREDTSALPPAYRVTLADAYLRAGRLHKASRLFEETLDGDPGEPWAGLVWLGRGWIAVRRRDLGQARDFFETAAETSGGAGLMADFMLGLLDAEQTQDADAGARFARIAENPDASEQLRLAATMAGGYARFWAGDDDGARTAFANAAAKVDGTIASDDAKYAVAIAQWRGGDRDGAEQALRALAATAPKRGPRISTGLANLDPRALVRAAARRYRRMPLGMPSESVLSMLTGDAPSQARVALRRLRAGGEPPAPLARSADAVPSHPAGVPTGRASHGSPAPAEGTGLAEPSSRLPLLLVFLMLAASVVWNPLRRKVVRR